MNKKKLTLAALAATMGTLSASAADLLLAGWETWGNSVLVGQTSTFSASVFSVDATASAFLPSATSGTVNNAIASAAGANNSGTFGSTAGGFSGASISTANATDGLRAASTSTQYADFTVTAGIDGINLTSFHFDTAMGGNQAQPIRQWTLSSLAGGSITEVADIATGGYLGFNGLTEVDIDLSTVADTILNTGEFATFRLSFLGNSNGGNGVRLDNVAIGGTGFAAAVPEPSTYALLGGLVAMTSVMLRRRRS